MVGMLFMEAMDDNEAIVITGAEQYSKYSGYADSFKFEGAHYDKLERDLGQRLQIQVTAIDAINVAHMNRGRRAQFANDLVLREINKVFVGISAKYDASTLEKLPDFVTGNWGCGAFGGDPHVKFLQQLVACRKAGRNMIYCCFDQVELQAELDGMWRCMAKHGTTIEQLIRLISNYYADLKDKCPYSFYEYFQLAMEGLEEDDED